MAALIQADAAAEQLIMKWARVAYAARVVSTQGFARFMSATLGVDTPEDGTLSVIYAGIAEDFPLSWDTNDDMRAVVILQDSNQRYLVTEFADNVCCTRAVKHGDVGAFIPCPDESEYFKARAHPDFEWSYADYQINAYDRDTERGIRDADEAVKMYQKWCPVTLDLWPLPLESFSTGND